MINLRELALERSQETGQEESAWLKVLESARINLRFLNVSSETLQTLARNCKSPEHFTLWLRLLYEHGRSFPRGEQLLRTVEERSEASAYPLEQWLAAMESLYRWADKQGSPFSLNDLLDYLTCCSELPDAKDGLSDFAAVVEDALEVYGVERFQKKSS